MTELKNKCHSCQGPLGIKKLFVLGFCYCQKCYDKMFWEQQRFYAKGKKIIKKYMGGK
jgi:hypothetical protein